MGEGVDELESAVTDGIVVNKGEVVGTGRLVYGNEDAAVRIGRMAVDAEWGRKGLGGRLLRFLEEEAATQGVSTYILNAQEYVKEFYASHGYMERGETFLEADIVHILMRKEAYS